MTWPPLFQERFSARLLSQDAARCGPWLAALPLRCAELAEWWHLTPAGDPRPGGAALVLPVMVGGRRRAALKLVSPLGDARAEHRALTLLAGEGMVGVLDVDLARDALLLELLEGPALAVPARADPLAAVAVAGRIARDIAAHPAPEDAPRLADQARPWREQLIAQHAEGRRRGDALPNPQRDAALESIDLLARTGSTTLTHGDLSLANVMRRADGTWVAIDPTLLAGPREHEAHTVLRGVLPWVAAAEDPAARLHHVLTVFCEAAEADLDLARRLSHARTVASYSWESQHGDPTEVEILRRAAGWHRA